MAISPEQRRAAQAERDSLKDVQAGADLAIAGVAALALLAVPPVGLVALIPAVIRWRASKELTVQERLIEDPPRPDFELPAEPEFERVHLDPEDPLAPYVRHSVAICAYEEAMIVSVERSLGAQEVGAGEHARARAREAEAFAELARAELDQAASSTWELRNLVASGELFEAEEALSRLDEPPPRPAAPLEALPEATAAWLFRVGAPADVFESWSEHPPPTAHPFGGLWDPVYRNGVTKRQLAAELIL